MRMILTFICCVDERDREGKIETESERKRVGGGEEYIYLYPFQWNFRQNDALHISSTHYVIFASARTSYIRIN